MKTNFEIFSGGKDDIIPPCGNDCTIIKEILYRTTSEEEVILEKQKRHYIWNRSKFDYFLYLIGFKFNKYGFRIYK